MKWYKTYQNRRISSRNAIIPDKAIEIPNIILMVVGSEKSALPLTLYRIQIMLLTAWILEPVISEGVTATKKEAPKVSLNKKIWVVVQNQTKVDTIVSLKRAFIDSRIAFKIGILLDCPKRRNMLKSQWYLFLKIKRKQRNWPKVVNILNLEHLK